jgi:protein MAK16
MQHDEMIWQVISHQFCSFQTTIQKAKSDKTTFCRHPYSVTGLCNRTSCPLANSKYATIREEDGKIHLYMKTVERAHSPKNLWEKILLSRNYARALHQLDEHLQYFPQVLIHRNKQRLTKIHQYLIRMRKLKLKERAGKKAKLVGVHRKVDQREERREKKALIAAKLSKSIEKELVQRLAKGTYGDIYNFPEVPYQKAMESVEQQQQEEEELEETESEEEEEEEESITEYVEDLEEEEEEDIEDMEYMGEGQWGMAAESDSEQEEEQVSDDDESNRSSSDDSSSSSLSDDLSTKKPPAKKQQPEKKTKPKRGTRVEIEYEEEHEDEHQAMVAEETVAGMAW